MSADRTEDPSCVMRAYTSPMLADPQWIRSFRSDILTLLDVGRDVLRHVSLPCYRQDRIERRWRPFLASLRDHVTRAVVASNARPSTWIRDLGQPFVMDSNTMKVDKALGLAWGALHEAADPHGPNEAMMNALEHMAELLSGWQDPSSRPADPPPSGTADPAPPPEAAGADASGSKARPPGDPVSRAVAAAMSLRKAGKPVSVRAACKAAGVDRKNLTARHPETVQLIEQLAEPDRKPPRGAIDRRTGSLDAWDDSEDV